MNRSALLVIDMLNDFVLEGAPLEVPGIREMVPRLHDAIENARKNQVPLIYVCDTHLEDDPEFQRMGWPPHAIAGTRGARVIDALAPLPGDTVISKRTYSGFFDTPLEIHLKSCSIDELLMSGCVTNICVLYTVADAVQRGYRVTVLSSCVAALSSQDHQFALRQMKDVLGARII